jgi:hypothetical protein
MLSYWFRFRSHFGVRTAVSDSRRRGFDSAEGFPFSGKCRSRPRESGNSRTIPKRMRESVLTGANRVGEEGQGGAPYLQSGRLGAPWWCTGAEQPNEFILGLKEYNRNIRRTYTEKIEGLRWKKNTGQTGPTFFLSELNRPRTVCRKKWSFEWSYEFSYSFLYTQIPAFSIYHLQQCTER